MEKAQGAISSLAEISHKPLLQLDCEKLGIRLGLPSLVQYLSYYPEKEKTTIIGGLLS